MCLCVHVTPQVQVQVQGRMLVLVPAGAQSPCPAALWCSALCLLALWCWPALSHSALLCQLLEGLTASQGCVQVQMRVRVQVGVLEMHPQMHSVLCSSNGKYECSSRKCTCMLVAFSAFSAAQVLNAGVSYAW